MINLENAKNEFKKYISNYDLNNPEIARKVGHSYRVAEISKRIAKSLDLEAEEIKLAELIGLLHDIAKIDQRSESKIYKDLEHIEHGDATAIILEKNNYIRKYVKDNKYDEIIKTAIINHSKYEIAKNIQDEKALMFCKIVRDSDKLDILYQAKEFFWKNGTKINHEITKDVLKEIKNETKAKREKVVTDIDKVIFMISFIYDINYLESFKITKENDYINKIMDKFKIENTKVKEEFKEIRKIANKYIKNKIQKER